MNYLAEYWLESNRAANEFFSVLPPWQGFSVSEEELLAEPTRTVACCLAALELPLGLTNSMKEEIDGTRNSQWDSLLTLEELRDLHLFVVDYRTEIDALLAGEFSSSFYLRLIDEASSRRPEGMS